MRSLHCVLIATGLPMTFLHKIPARIRADTAAATAGLAHVHGSRQRVYEQKMERKMLYGWSPGSLITAQLAVGLSVKRTFASFLFHSENEHREQATTAGERGYLHC